MNARWNHWGMVWALGGMCSLVCPAWGAGPAVTPVAIRFTVVTVVVPTVQSTPAVFNSIAMGQGTTLYNGTGGLVSGISMNNFGGSGLQPAANLQPQIPPAPVPPPASAALGPNPTPGTSLDLPGPPLASPNALAASSVDAGPTPTPTPGLDNDAQQQWWKKNPSLLELDAADVAPDSVSGSAGAP